MAGGFKDDLRQEIASLGFEIWEVIKNEDWVLVSSNANEWRRLGLD